MKNYARGFKSHRFHILNRAYKIKLDGKEIFYECIDSKNKPEKVRNLFFVK